MFKTNRMGPRFLASLVLALFLTGLFPTTVGEVLHALSGETSPVQAGENHCPDPGNDGAPCGPDCACVCCPGQRVAVAFPILPPAVAIPLATELDMILPVALHPTAVDPAIFHPPRA